jgi:ubiquinone biosynthesis protein Coq4
MAQTYDIYDALTGDELDQVTNIFLDALSRQNNISPEVFELVTNIIVD